MTTLHLIAITAPNFTNLQSFAFVLYINIITKTEAWYTLIKYYIYFQMSIWSSNEHNSLKSKTSSP